MGICFLSEHTHTHSKGRSCGMFKELWVLSCLHSLRWDPEHLVIKIANHAQLPIQAPHSESGLSHSLEVWGKRGKNVSHLLISVLWQEHLSPQFCLAEQPPRSQRQKRDEHLLEVVRCCQDHQARCGFYWESSFQGKGARGGTLAGQTSLRRHLFLCAAPAERAGSTAASNPNPPLVFVFLSKTSHLF